MTGFAAKALKLMIIGNFDVVRTILEPFKTYSPLVVDADTALTQAVTSQRFETIARQAF